MITLKTGPFSARKAAIPQATSEPDALLRSVNALKEAVEIGSGARGDPLDRFVTVRELGASGVASVDSRGAISPSSSAKSVTPDPGAAVFNPGDPNFGLNDYAPPPAPTGVAAHGVSHDTIAVTWDVPPYTHHAYTEVFFLAGDGSFDAMIAAPVTFNRNQPVSAQNPEDNYAGSSYGTIYMHTGLTEGDGATLDSLLEPTPRFYWVRFVSTAGVPGPFNTTGTGVIGVPFVDAGRVIDAMMASVSDNETYNNLRALLGRDVSSIAKAGGIESFVNLGDAANREKIDTLATTIGDWTIANQTISQVAARDDGTLQSTWTVRMMQTNGGVNYAAGFGLGMTTDAATGKSTSSFIVNADQFAVMGVGAPAVALLSFATVPGYPNRATVTWEKPTAGTTGIVAGSTMQVVADSGSGSILAQLAGLTCSVLSIDEDSASATLQLDGNWPISNADADACTKYGLGLIAESSMPFIVDTLRGVVGIKGSVIVNGLIYADSGQFDDLSSATAFIQKLTASVINANVIVGQRIVAGIVGAGQVQDTDIDGYASNYIIELNNPVTGRSPLRYYLPKGADGLQHVAFELTKNGGMNVGGNLSVGKNAVVRTTGNYLTSLGGTNAQGKDFALWIGAQSDYEGGHPTNPDGFNETNAIMYVRGDGAVGMNRGLFLGNDPLTIPSGSGDITVIAGPNGTIGTVFASVNAELKPNFDGTVQPDTTERDPIVYATLFLAPSNAVVNGIDYPDLMMAYETLPQSLVDFLNAHIDQYNSPTYDPNATTGMVSTAGWIKLCFNTFTWSGMYDSGHLPIVMQGAAPTPPGKWKTVLRLQIGGFNHLDYICINANFFAMQTQTASA